MRFIGAACAALCLTSCSMGSGILASGGDTYTVSEHRAPVLGGAMKAKQDALTEANAYCQSKGLSFFTVREAEGGINPWGPTNYDLTFRCAGAAVSSVDDLPLSDTQYRIIAKGGSTSDEVEDLVLLDASEIALKHGYHGFVINSASDRSINQVMTTPASRTINVGGTAFGGNNFAVATGSGTSSYTPSSSTVLFEAGKSVFVTLVQQGGYDARLIYAKLASKYGKPPIP